jgi:uncharacterized protein with PIN domain
MTASRGETKPYEVRCLRCNTSFAPETRRCIHCGGPVGRRAAAAPRGVLDEAVDEEEIQLRLAPARFALWAATLLIAVVASLLRTCQ